MPWLPLNLKSFPTLTSAVTGTVFEWNHGPMYNVLLTNSYVRISELGIQWSSLSRLPATKVGGVGWSTSGLSCVPVRDAFCLTPTSPEVSMFPKARVEVVAGGSHALVFGGGTQCNTQTANREFILGSAGYQASLCDLTDSKLDVLLDLDSAEIYWKHRDDPFWWNVLVTMSCLFFFTRVCEHLVMLVQGKRRDFSPSTTVALGTMLLLHRILLWLQVLSEHLVTREEQLLDNILEIYCWGHICLQIATIWSARNSGYQYLRITEDASKSLRITEDASKSLSITEDASKSTASSADISTLGLLLCVQMILTAHLQSSYDNPFLGVLVILFGMRSNLKFLNFMLVYTNCERNSENTEIVLKKLVFLCVDTFTLASILELGVRSGARSAVEQVSTTSGILLAVVLGGAFLHEVIHSK